MTFLTIYGIEPNLGEYFINSLCGKSPSVVMTVWDGAMLGRHHPQQGALGGTWMRFWQSDRNWIKLMVERAKLHPRD